MAPKPRFSKIKSGLKTAGVIALSTAVGVGVSAAYFKIDRNKQLSEFNKDKVQYAQKRFDESELSELNSTSKLGKIKYLDKEKMQTLNLRFAKFKEIKALIPLEQQTVIDSIIKSKISTVEKEASRNPKLRKAIGSKSYLEYLLSLKPETIEIIFKKEIPLIKAELNKIPKSKLKALNEKLGKSFGNATLFGAVIGFFISGIGTEIIRSRKKEEEYNFH